jgi:predicted AAA+ superfamily ATPase
VIERKLENIIRRRLGTDMAIMVFGARQTGKTTLLETVFEYIDDVLWFNADDSEDLQRLNALFDDPEYFLDGIRYLVIDEAQAIENVGRKLKVLHDKYKHRLQIIATGSSSFDLANKVNEPMTGRKWEYHMHPLTFSEMCDHHGAETEKSLLKRRLLYGYYPNVVTHVGDEREVLAGLSNSTLYKDVLKFSEIRHADKIADLLKALAHQIGRLVDYAELATLLDLDQKTVRKYIRILEQAFIIFKLKPYSRNARNEIKSKHKIYFYDLGIRNALIGDWRSINERDDAGHMFENYVIAELKKTQKWENYYFWRDKKQQEIDLIQEVSGAVNAYEIKLSPKAKAKIPSSFIMRYAPKTAKIVNSSNFDELMAFSSANTLF